MRPLTSSEKNLALALGVIWGLALTAFLLYMFWNTLQTTQRQIASFQNQLKEANTLLKESDIWLQRVAWLDQSLEVAPPGGLANSALLTMLSNSARENAVTIINQSVASLDPDPFFTLVGIDLTVTATMENFVKWIHGFQKPHTLTGVTRISLRSDADPTKIRADIRIVRYYAPAGGTT